MRILFVCGGTGGGAAMSTHELADALVATGDEVRVVQSARGADRLHRVQRRLLNASVKLARTPFAGALRSAAGTVGRRTTAAAVPGGRADVVRVTAPVVENAVPAALAEFRPRVVVVNSVDRATWRAVWQHAHRAGVSVVLYIREETGLGHVDDPQARPDAVVANAAALAEGATARGVPAPFIASVVDLERSRVEPSRERVVFVNPIELNGLELAVPLATACPDVPFTFVESWRLDDGAVHTLTSRLAALPNVRFQRRSDDPHASYAEASVLLAPCLTDTRPAWCSKRRRTAFRCSRPISPRCARPSVRAAQPSRSTRQSRNGPPRFADYSIHRGTPRCPTRLAPMPGAMTRAPT